MFGRDELIREWRDRLARSEAELDCVSPHRRWIKRIYVRLFRFLLAFYGRGDWTADEAGGSTGEAKAGEDDSHLTHTELIDLRTEPGGAPPKGVAQIRRTLKSIHVAAESTEQTGPYATGLRPADWIVVASQHDGIRLEQLARALYSAGVPCRRRRRGRDSVIEVRYQDEKAAWELLDRLGNRIRESPRERRIRIRRERGSRTLLAAVVCSLMGGVLPILAFVSSRDQRAHAKADDLLLVFIGMLVGGALGGLAAYGIARRRE